MRNTKKNAVKLTKIALAVSAALCLAPNAYAVPANTQLPIQDQSFTPIGGVNIDHSGNVMKITQKETTSVIKWQDFSVGADATVNFSKEDLGNFNSVNFVDSGKVSEIYGQINAQNGNIVIANPAGVQIGSSAQINVGSLYVTNKDLSALETIDKDKITSKSSLADITSYIANQQAGAAELMSLGGIVTGGTVTFDGERIVIDTDHLYKNNSGDSLDTASQLIVQTTDKDNVVLGYTAYDEAKGTYAGQQKDITLKELIVKNENNETVEEESGADKAVAGYMWVENLRQLQAMETAPDANYALRNSIDANYTADAEYDYSSDKGYGFDPIGNEGANQAFIGKFDGLGYDIFDLNISRDGEDYVGLFGYADGAVIRNFTINSGNISGKNYTGAAVGYAVNSTIENIINTAGVSGNNNTGGVVGYAVGDNTDKSVLSGLINVGTINGQSNVGGIVGAIENTSIIGTTYNLGAITGTANNVGGITGSAKYSVIGNEEADTEDDIIYNSLNVTGAYNVGGIVGTMSGTTVQNVSNYGTVLATGSVTDTYYYHSADQTVDRDGDGIVSVEVAAANAGGIVGRADNNSRIELAENSGDVLTSTRDGGDSVGTYYIAGNVGGIVGSAYDTDILNVENKENDVRGAHNVGGIAGYLAGSSTVNVGINNGGDILATGARLSDNSGFATESVRNDHSEVFNIGNIGGIVGYMYDDDVYVTASANRGTVHSAEISDTTVPETAKAANVGGIVGKIDRNSTKNLSDIKNDGSVAAVSYSYNTGDVQGYTGVGGIIGFMYNGEVTGSYNLGSIMSTRSASTNKNSVEALNMGGIVGDTTEGTDASALIYDVYNEGTIGDSDFIYSGRHVGGIVGRLSGTVDKAYNTGDIYNGYNVTGGIVGYWNVGSISNTFNTGNITVYNQNGATSQVGGIVGAANLGIKSISLTYSYNLGTIRSFQASDAGTNTVGGIIGEIVDYPDQDGVTHSLTVSDVYTLGNLYADGNGSSVGAIYGTMRNPVQESNINISKAVYIAPEISGVFSTLTNRNQTATILYADMDDQDAWVSVGFTFNNAVANQPGEVGGWRIYEGTSPILNAFLPNMASTEDSWKTDNISNIQYGTAANPLLTIIDATGDLTFDWSQIGLSGAGSLAVYGNNSLTFNNFTTEAGRYYGGTIFSEGALTINAANNGSSDVYVNFGAGSNLYGDSITINGRGNDVTINGTLTAIGEDISINGDDVEIVGKLQAVDSATIDGISKDKQSLSYSREDVRDRNIVMPHINEVYSTSMTKATSGNIAITGTGCVEVLYGHLATGSVFLGKDNTLSVEGSESVYVDTDLYNVKGNISLSSSAGEVLLDISNTAIEHEEANGQTVSDAQSLHAFLENHSGSSSKITLSGANGDEKITVDMWNGNSFDLDQYDLGTNTLVSVLDNLNIEGSKEQNSDYVYIWVSSAEQLAGIQDYAEVGTGNKNILSYNFALKNDIDASALTDYTAIGTESKYGYTGTFDGRDNRIIGLNVGANDAGTTAYNAGIFSTIGADGVVTNLRVYGSSFYGKDSAGAIAGINNGTIYNITTLGNHIEVFGSGTGVSYDNQTIGVAGGIAGLNTGTIRDISASDSVVAGSSGGIETTAGGIVGLNQGKIGGEDALDDENHVVADSAVTSRDKNSSLSLGGIAGINMGNMTLITATGVTHGEYGDGNITSDNVGGVVGINNRGTIVSAYNSGDVTGGNRTGGIAGDNSGRISNAVNAGDILADSGDFKYAGGMAGYNSGIILNGRNTGEIYGYNYVGGMVGGNAESAELTDLSNSVFAYITGEHYVGGIAGENAGTISANDSNLQNYGKIFGQKYVGGIAGSNTDTGSIVNTESSISLYVKDTSEEALYFGGVVGQNSGKIEGATNSSDINISASDSSYVGGIIGQNTTTGTLIGEIRNDGAVSGKQYVGGIIGENLNTTLLDNSTGTQRLVITNNGRVEGGGAAGIFYSNNSKISNVDLINTGEIHNDTTVSSNSAYGGLFGINNGEIENSTLTNLGTVSGDGIVGGLIGQNNGKITESTLKNSGTVTGTGENSDDATGGLIGQNTGVISLSSLINSTEAVVEGKINTGGLIGSNSGTITGGRTDAEDKDVGYYKYQIYNNGTVLGSSNVGGLIGSNTNGGSLTAAYNTGTVNGGNNVGGVVGNNAGTVDQVFNTVINSDGSFGVVTGSNNVGGIIGINSSKLSNSYSRGDVTATAENGVAGNAVGNNSATGTIEYIYSTVGTAGTKLIGSNNNATEGAIKYAYSYVAGDTSATVITDTDYQSRYNGFDFDGVWKIYEGNSNPLLKVFLTKLTINDSVEINDETVTLNDYLNLVYNAGEQDVNIVDLIEKGFITGPEGWTDAFLAYYNTKDVDSTYGDSSLLFNTAGQINADSYSDWLASAQIAFGSETPNNLGYDFDLPELTVNKATLSIKLDEIWRQYGNGQMYSDKDLTQAISDYLEASVSYKDSEGNTIAVNEDMLTELKSILKVGAVSDGAVVDNLQDGKTTNDAGTYQWSITYTIDEKVSGSSNYQFAGTDTGTTTASANSYVTKADLTVSLDDVNRIYGNVSISGGGYTVTYDGLTNGDSLTIDSSAVKDGALRDGTHTNDAETYTWTIGTDALTGINVNNYTITFINGASASSTEGVGVSTVSKADLTIAVDNETTTVGNLPDGFSGTDINEALVNGDTFNADYSYGLINGNSFSVDVAGEYKDVIGIWINDVFYDITYEGKKDWTSVSDIFKNYNVTYTLGDLIVSEMPELDLRSPYGHVYQEGWDRQRNFRERKAEVYFHEGGVNSPESF